uniref:FZ domain-containing protein n=1 Tax=Angiostrongylus cantonensis TaxID=6313 RepID=A0A0K0CVI1_ANGCA
MKLSYAPWNYHILLVRRKRNGYLPGVDVQLEPFDVPLSDLEKDAEPVTTLNEQCSRFLNHYRYFCRTSDIATYNEEVRIICERYRTYCSDRVYPSVNHIRRQIAFWKHSGLPVGAQKALTRCYSHCKETDPVCVNACECLHLQWVMNYECYPGIRAPAGPNCQRWAQKCRAVWKPLPDYTPSDFTEVAPWPLVRGQFYGYNALGNYRTFNRPREHGVSFYRGTNTVLVDWPEGKVSSGSVVEVPAVGVNVIYNALDVGFPNPRRTLSDLTKENPDPLNPGTGRKKGMMAIMRRT